jgi:hypothetical protein
MYLARNRLETEYIYSRHLKFKHIIFVALEEYRISVCHVSQKFNC